MLESSRDIQMPRYSRCRDIVGSKYTGKHRINKISLGKYQNIPCDRNVQCEGVDG